MQSFAPCFNHRTVGTLCQDRVSACSQRHAPLGFLFQVYSIINMGDIGDDRNI